MAEWGFPTGCPSFSLISLSKVSTCYPLNYKALQKEVKNTHNTEFLMFLTCTQQGQLLIQNLVNLAIK